MPLDPNDFFGVRPRSATEKEEEVLVSQARSAAIRWIGLGRKSSGRVQDYLLRLGFGSDIVEQVINDFKSEGKIDDLRLARRQEKARTGAKAESSQRFAQRLAANGLDRAAIDQVLMERPADHEQALAALQGTCDPMPDGTALTALQRQKYYRFLASRGFSSEIAHRAIREFFKGFSDNNDCND